MLTERKCILTYRRKVCWQIGNKYPDRKEKVSWYLLYEKVSWHKQRKYPDIYKSEENVSWHKQRKYRDINCRKKYFERYEDIFLANMKKVTLTVRKKKENNLIVQKMWPQKNEVTWQFEKIRYRKVKSLKRKNIAW